MLAPPSLAGTAVCEASCGGFIPDDGADVCAPLPPAEAGGSGGCLVTSATGGVSVGTTSDGAVKIG